MNEIVALRAMLDHDLFIKYGGVLSEVKNMQNEHKQILASIDEYYKEYPKTKGILPEELETFFSLANPASKGQAFNQLFTGIRGAQLPNEELVTRTLDHFVEVHVCSQIAQIADAVINGQQASGMEEIEGLVKQYQEAVSPIKDGDDFWYTERIADVIARQQAGAIPWGLHWLNDHLGQVKPGTLGHIFARPDSGKTSFALNQIAWFATYMMNPKINMGGELLYLNNEEHPGVVKGRLIQAALDIEKEALDAAPDEYEDKYIKKCGGRISIKGDINHIRDVERCIKAAKHPRIVVIDQGGKVWFPGARDMTGPDRLKMLYNKYRSLAKNYGIAILTIGQASEKAHDQRILHMNFIDNSHTGIPGECDWILGIGRVHKPELENTRWLNVAKKKSNAKGGYIEVKLNKETCRYEEYPKSKGE